MTRLRASATFLSLLLASLTASPATAQTANAGTPVVSVHTTDEIEPVLVRDGLGGAYIGYQTILTTSPAMGMAHGIIHVARLLPDATPNLDWTPSQADPVWNGLGQSTNIVTIGSTRVWAVGNAEDPAMNGTYLHYMLQVESSGVTPGPVQAARGVRFFTDDVKALPQPDGHAMIFYMLGTFFNEPGLLVDRVDPSGGLTHQSIPFGFDYTVGSINRVNDAIAGGDGSAIAVVNLSQQGSTGWDLHAVSLQADGSPAWAPAARTLTTATGHQREATCASDGAGGLFVAWQDDRSAATSPDLYATHMLSDGTLAPGWAVNGKAISAISGEQSHVSTVADGAGGVWLVWTDARSGNLEVYHTHLHADGTPAAGFTVSGRPLSGAPGAKRDPLAVSDGMGGLFAVWRDGRNLVDFDLYGQHILPDGSLAPGLALDGEPICTNPTDQTDLALLDISPGAAIVVWRDNRTGVGIQYAARVPFGNGNLGVPGQRTARLELTRAGSNPARGAIEWTVSGADQGEVSVRLIDITGRVVDARTLPAGADHAIVRFTPARPGLYFVIATQGNVTSTGRVAFAR